FCFGFLGGHGFVYPLIGGLQVGSALIGFIAFAVGLLAVNQVHIGHGVIVVLAQRKGFIQVVDSVLNDWGGSVTQLGANFLIFQRLIRTQPEFCPLFHAGLESHGPIDDADRVIGFGIVLVEIDGFLVISTRVIEFLHLQRQSGNALDAVYVLGVLGQDSLVLIDGAVGIGEVVGRVYARNILSDIGGSQIELGI